MWDTRRHRPSDRWQGIEQQSKCLFTHRHRPPVGVYHQLAGPLSEQQNFVNPALQKQLLKSCQASLTAIEKDRKAIDKAIDQLVDGDDQLKQLLP